METIQELWRTFLSTTPPPDIWMAVVAFAVGAALAIYNRAWAASRHVVTLVHEAGHAIVGVMTGRRLNGIKLHSDTSGVTSTSGVGWGLSGMLTTMAGYPAPAAAGGIMLSAIYLEHTYAAAYLTLAVLVILLLFTRNLWGWVVTGGAVVVLAGLLWKTGTLPLQIVLLVTSALLIVGSVRTLIEERARRKTGLDGSDISNLAARTGVPATVWWVIELTLCAGWVFLGAYLILA